MVPSGDRVLPFPFVKTQILVTTAFDASHEDSQCSGYAHGHRFEVEAWGEKDLREPLDEVVSELDGRTLGRMLNGGGQDGHSIARWLLERLMVTNPEVDGASVAFGRRKFSVTRERR